MTLADRIETEEPTRELNDEFLVKVAGYRIFEGEAVVSFVKGAARTEKKWLPPEAKGSERGFSYPRGLPAPLDSVDDALQFVPEGYSIIADFLDPEIGNSVTLHKEGYELAACPHGTAPTPARALSAALARIKEADDGT